MKISLNTFTLLIGSAVCFFGCGSEPVNHEISIALDQTEEYMIHISFEEFMKMCGLSENESNGEHVRIQAITETGFNEIKEFTIKSVENPMMDNDYNRQKELANYFAGIERTFDELNKGKMEMEGSVIFKIIADELNRLSKSGADKKVLIVVTDGMENSSLANFYDPKIFNQIKNDPDNVQNLFIEKYPLNDSSGIEIYFVYQPLDREDSERFEIVSGFYKALFESCGATIIIGGSL